MLINDNKSWVAVVNSNTCQIYSYSKKPEQLTLLKEIDHPESKLKNSELTSDKSGSYKARDAVRGNYSPHMDAKEIEINNFAREVAKTLGHERSLNSYDRLILIASARTTGLIFQHIDKHVKELITHNIQKDILHLANHELLDFIKTNT
jgi:protein required for attachment to host cells